MPQDRKALSVLLCSTCATEFGITAWRGGVVRSQLALVDHPNNLEFCTTGSFRTTVFFNDHRSALLRRPRLLLLETNQVLVIRETAAAVIHNSHKTKIKEKKTPRRKTE